MITQIYKEFTSKSFASLGKNNVKHKDIVKCFFRKKTGHYAEIYAEIWGYSVHLYGKGFTQGYFPTIIDITEKKDIKNLIL